jgi:hypothetical protein
MDAGCLVALRERLWNVQDTAIAAERARLCLTESTNPERVPLAHASVNALPTLRKRVVVTLGFDGWLVLVPVAARRLAPSKWSPCVMN